MSQVTITRDEHGDRGAYLAHVPGSDHAGRLTWVAQGNLRIADHTFVPTQLRGHGIALSLVEALVADAREQGFRIVPECSYVAAAFARHPDWAGLKA